MLGGDLAYLGRARGGHRPSSPGPAARRGDRRSPWPGARVHQSHRRADDAGTAPGIGATGAGGARGDPPVRDRQRPARREPDRGAARDRRLGRGRQAQRRRAPRHHLELPVLAAHHPRRRRDRPRRVRRRASAPRGRERHAARGPRCSASTTPTSQSSPSGSAGGPTRTPPSGTAWRGRASARLPRSASSCAPRGCAHRRSWRRSRAPAGTPAPFATGSPGRRSSSPSLAARPRRPSAVTPNAEGWLALAEAEYARARGVARPESWSEAADSWERLERPPLVAYCRWRQAEALVAAGASRAEAAVPLREAHAVAARIGARPLLRELELLAQRARLDLAPPQAASSAGKQGAEEILGLTATRGGGPEPRRPRLHQPRDRRDARHQRQDRQRPRLAHPAQARGAEQARGSRDRPPPRPATRRAT